MRWRIAVAVLLALCLGVATGCDDSRGTTDGATSSEAASPSVDATVTTPASGDPGAVENGASASSAVDDGSGAAPSAATPEDQEAIQQELDAIIRELDAMTLPDDADFNDIESALGQ